MSGTLKIGGKTLATHDTSSNKLAFHSDANDTGQLCRAWVNFNGTLDENSGGLTAGENVLIRASYNVSSCQYNGTGDYTINFATAMPDANYSISGMASRFNILIADVNGFSGTDPTPSSFRIRTYATNFTISNGDFITLAIFR